MGLIPFVLFWVLLYLGRRELTLKWILLCIALWVGGLVGLAVLTGPYPRMASYLFMSFQAVIDIALVLAIFKGDIPISNR
jgi:hypothetical protein